MPVCLFSFSSLQPYFIDKAALLPRHSVGSALWCPRTIPVLRRARAALFLRNMEREIWRTLRPHVHSPLLLCLSSLPLPLGLLSHIRHRAVQDALRYRHGDVPTSPRFRRMGSASVTAVLAVAGRDICSVAHSPSSEPSNHRLRGCKRRSCCIHLSGFVSENLRPDGLWPF
jgi:hypothetical protein